MGWKNCRQRSHRDSAVRAHGEHLDCCMSFLLSVGSFDINPRASEARSVARRIGEWDQSDDLAREQARGLWHGQWQLGRDRRELPPLWIVGEHLARLELVYP